MIHTKPTKTIEPSNNMKTTTPNKPSKMTSALARVATLIVAATLLAGCGSKLSGTYKADGHGAMFEKLTFTSGNNAEITMFGGLTQEVPYVVEGDKVKIGPKGDAIVFAIDKKGRLVLEGELGKLTFTKR